MTEFSNLPIDLVATCPACLIGRMVMRQTTITDVLTCAICQASFNASINIAITLNLQAISDQ